MHRAPTSHPSTHPVQFRKIYTSGTTIERPFRRTARTRITCVQHTHINCSSCFCRFCEWHWRVIGSIFCMLRHTKCVCDDEGQPNSVVLGPRVPLQLHTHMILAHPHGARLALKRERQMSEADRTCAACHTHVHDELIGGVHFVKI